MSEEAAVDLFEAWWAEVTGVEHPAYDHPWDVEFDVAYTYPDPWREPVDARVSHEGWVS